jgi:hypothetical protein
MAIFEKLKKSFSGRELEAYLDLIHENAVIVFHKSGGKLSKTEWAIMFAGMFSNEKCIQESSRCVYENDDILVTHDFMSFPDDTREAVMVVYKFQDGKIIHIENGSTSLT